MLLRNQLSFAYKNCSHAHICNCTSVQICKPYNQILQNLHQAPTTRSHADKVAPAHSTQHRYGRKKLHTTQCRTIYCNRYIGIASHKVIYSGKDTSIQPNAKVMCGRKDTSAPLYLWKNATKKRHRVSFFF